MTPALPDILIGQVVSLNTPLPPEASGDYLAGRTGILAMLAMLAAQEAERGVAARVWENGALRELFARAAGAYDETLNGRLAADAGGRDEDLAWSALDRANAQLRRLLIDLHVEVERGGDPGLDTEILQLYQAMARVRRLELPAGIGG